MSIDLLRSYRIGEYALFDIVLTIAGVILLAPLLSKLFHKLRVNIPKSSWYFLALPISIVTHLTFGKDTPLVTNFLDPNSNLLVKVMVILSFVWGIKDIRVINKKVNKFL